MSTNSINQNTEHSHYLQKLIQLAQMRNRQAIDELCLRFKPLIYKEARRETVYKSLGEDAVNIAWEIFLRFIYQYRGSDYVHLPGLIQCRIRYGLINYIKKQGLIWDNEVVLSDCAKENLLSDCMLEKHMEHVCLQAALTRLTPLQRKVVDAFYFQNISIANISKIYKYTRCNANNIKLRGLTELKKQIA